MGACRKSSYFIHKHVVISTDKWQILLLITFSFSYKIYIYYLLIYLTFSILSSHSTLFNKMKHLYNILDNKFLFSYILLCPYLIKMVPYALFFNKRNTKKVEVNKRQNHIVVSLSYSLWNDQNTLQNIKKCISQDSCYYDVNKYDKI